LVLALALIFNDFRGLVIGFHLLRQVPAPDKRTPAKGQRAGLEVYLLRLIAGLTHELLELIRSNNEVLKEPSFVRITKQMPREFREPWNSLMSAASSNNGRDEFTRALLLIRNKVGFHYDTKELLRGYRLAFGAETKFGRPSISNGTSLITSQFYFADASASAYIEDGITPGFLNRREWQEMFTKGIHSALFGVVTSFLQSRGFAFKEERPE
jgi:hypothetical protein